MGQRIINQFRFPFGKMGQVLLFPALPNPLHQHSGMILTLLLATSTSKIPITSTVRPEAHAPMGPFKMQTIIPLSPLLTANIFLTGLKARHHTVCPDILEIALKWK